MVMHHKYVKVSHVYNRNSRFSVNVNVNKRKNKFLLKIMNYVASINPDLLFIFLRFFFLISKYTY